MDNNLFDLILLSSKKEPCACITNLTCCRRAPRQVTPACLPQVLKQLTSTFLSSSFWSTHVSHLQWIFFSGTRVSSFSSIQTADMFSLEPRASHLSLPLGQEPQPRDPFVKVGYSPPLEPKPKRP